MKESPPHAARADTAIKRAARRLNEIICHHDWVHVVAAKEGRLVVYVHRLPPIPQRADVPEDFEGYVVAFGSAEKLAMNGGK